MAQNENENEKEEAKGFDLSRVIEDAKSVITQPVEFYRAMPQTGGFTEPCIFLAVMAVLMGAMTAVLSLFGLGHIGAMAIGFSSLFLFPIMALIGSFIGALIMFVIWKLMGSTKDYEAAYRCVSYASVIYLIMPLVGWIPCLGTIVSLGLGMYLMYIATMEVHGIKQQTAQTAIGILAAVLLLMQLSGEYNARNYQAKMEAVGEKWQKSAEEASKTFEKMAKKGEDMTPEEAGKALGEFLKGMSEAMPEDVKRKMEEAAAEAEAEVKSNE